MPYKITYFNRQNRPNRLPFLMMSSNQRDLQNPPTVADPDIPSDVMFYITMEQAAALEHLKKGNIRLYWASILNIKSTLKLYFEPNCYQNQLIRKWQESKQKK